VRDQLLALARGDGRLSGELGDILDRLQWRAIEAGYPGPAPQTGEALRP